MTIDWKALSDRKLMMDDRLRDEILSHWSRMDDVNQLPTMIRHLLKDEIDLLLLYFRDESSQPEHRPTFMRMQEMDLQVYGTLNARHHAEFQSVYEQYGWQTIVYILLYIRHPAIPEDNGEDLPSLMITVPAILVSKEADALTEEEIYQSILTFNTALSAMLLRVGLTLFATRAQCLWNSIPGMLMLVSPDSLFMSNQLGQESLRIAPIPRRGSVPLSGVFPTEVCQWIHDTIGPSGIYDPQDGLRVFWLDMPDGQQIRAHMTLIPYRQWDNIQTTDHMSTGFEGISMNNVHLINLLLIQDTTREWYAETLEQQMDLARRMQQELLPETTPDAAHLDISAVCRPASNVGGDIYDFAELDNGRIAVMTGDATGHGVDSALLAAVASGAFRTAIQTHSSPLEVLESMDQVLRSTRQTGFVTLSYLVFSADGSQVDVGLAGHYPPVVCRDGKMIGGLETTESLPLGVNLPPLYYVKTLDLKPGDVVATISDGFLESLSPDGATFLNILPAIMVNACHESITAEEVTRLLVRSVEKHTAERPVEDDLTAVVVSIKKRR